MSLVRTVSKLLRPLQRRVDLMVTRAVVRAVDSSTARQTLQVELLNGELASGVENFEQYGYTSHPHKGSGGIGLFVGGSRAHGLVICAGDKKYRIKGLKEGEVAMYTDEGDYIHFKRNREIHVEAGEKLVAHTKVADITADTSAKITSPLTEVVATTKVVMTTPLCELSGNMSVGGDLAVAGTGTVVGALASATSVADPTGSMQGMRDTYNGHNHPENDSGGPTDPPNQSM